MKSKLCTILISLLIVLSLSACSSEKNDWRWKLISESHPDDLFYFTVSPISGSVVGTDPGSDTLYLSRDAKSLEEIFLPETGSAEHLEVRGGLRQLCFADEIWVVTSNDQVISYNPGTHSWTLHPEWSNLEGSKFCYVTRDGRLLIWGANKLNLFDGQWTTITWPFEYNAISQDAAGTLWLFIGGQGELYRLDGNSPSFVRSFDILSAVNLFVSSTGDVWMGDSDVYRWRPTETSGSVDLVLDFGEQGSVDGIYEDSTGRIWIVESHEIWIYAGEKLEKVNMPEYSSQWMFKLPFFIPHRVRHDEATFIMGSAFDYQKDRLYVATEDGIYYLDVLGSSAQSGK